MTVHEIENLISRALAAEMLAVTVETLAKWEKKKPTDLPVFKIGRFAHYRSYDVTTYMKEELDRIETKINRLTKRESKLRHNLSRIK